MRDVKQRVIRSSEENGGKLKSAIGKGMVVLVGVEEADDEKDQE